VASLPEINPASLFAVQAEGVTGALALPSELSDTALFNMYDIFASGIAF
jgi:hypothetical protein